MLSRCCRIINKTTLKNLLNKQLKLASIGNIRKFNSTLPRSDTKSTLSSTDSLTINAPEIESSGTPLNEDNLSLIDGSQEIVNAIGSNIPEMGWGPKYQIMNLIENLHIFADMPYWESLIIISIGVRFLLLPIAIKTAQNTARLAALRPDLQRLQDAFNNNPNSADLRVKTQYQMDMKALFLKHKVNPIMSFLMPLFQLPIFIAFFTALRDIGTYYPGVATGGAYWFTDLTAPDLFLILPILNGITFLLMVEVGADGLATGQKNSFKMAMRLVSIAIVPLTMSMPQV
jgi:YidC/Oxa1 family membrane protein insertase